MSRLMIASMLIGSVLAGEGLAKAAVELETEDVVHVCVLDHAGVPAPLLERARRVTERIYEDAGVRLNWLAAAESDSGRIMCDGPTGSSVLILRLLPESKASLLPTYKMQFGLALLTNDARHASNAYIFVEKVAAHAEEQSMSCPDLLGFVMAHEMGHLLLGTNSHSRQGIMRSRWNPVDLESTYRARQRFLAKQKRSIRENVRARIQPETESASR
jgi:hypothetical protein